MSYDTFDRFVETLSWHEKLALFLTQQIGTMFFVYIVLLFIGVWMLFTVYSPYAFDDCQNFTILFIVLAILDFIFVPLILAGQNLLSKYNEIREEVDFERNKNIEDHLLTMEVMLNEIVPITHANVEAIKEGITELDNVIIRIPEEIRGITQQEELLSEEIDDEQVVHTHTDMLGYDYITVDFNSNKQQEVNSVVLNAFAKDSSYRILPTKYNADGSMSVVVICPIGKAHDASQKIQLLLEGADS